MTKAMLKPIYKFHDECQNDFTEKYPSNLNNSNL